MINGGECCVIGQQRCGVTARMLADLGKQMQLGPRADIALRTVKVIGQLIPKSLHLYPG